MHVSEKTVKELEAMYAISKEGQQGSSIDDFYSSIQIKNKYIIGNLLVSDDIYTSIRKTIKKLFDDVKITNEEIADIMANDVIKREVIDSAESKKAKKEIEKKYKKIEKAKEKDKEANAASAAEDKPETA
ncbi:MAG: hypothetical protein LBB48_05180, partial [Treponema sp.]|nr:hypothetical protein [Treponema sp.]